MAKMMYKPKRGAEPVMWPAMQDLLARVARQIADDVNRRLPEGDPRRVVVAGPDRLYGRASVAVITPNPIATRSEARHGRLVSALVSARV